MLLTIAKNLSPHQEPPPGFGHSSFVHSNLIRHSSFVIRHSAHRRGNAEIETILVIPVLLALLFLMKGSLQLGTARLLNVFQAEQKAYADATTPTPPAADSDSGTLDPLNDLASALPALPDQFPNRMHVSNATMDVNYGLNIPLPDAHLQNQAAFPAPAWAYSAWPVGDQGGSFNDASATHAWFSDYTAQVRTDTITNALGLSPSSPP